MAGQEVAFCRFFSIDFECIRKWTCTFLVWLLKSQLYWWLPWLSVGHTEKIYSIKFHPLASGVLVSSSYDLTVRLWNLESGEQVKILTGHQDQVGCYCSKEKLFKKHNLSEQRCFHKAKGNLWKVSSWFGSSWCSCSGVWNGVESRRKAAGHSLQGWESSHLWPSQICSTCASMAINYRTAAYKIIIIWLTYIFSCTTTTLKTSRGLDTFIFGSVLFL